MKKILSVFSLIGMLSGPVFAGDVEDVSAATEVFRQGPLNHDKAALEKSILPDLIYVHSTGVKETAEQFLAAIVDGPGKKDSYKKAEFNHQQIATDGKIAIVRHIFDVELSTKGRNNEQPYSLHLGIVQIWKKQDGAWRLQARQSMPIPF